MDHHTAVWDHHDWKSHLRKDTAPLPGLQVDFVHMEVIVHHENGHDIQRGELMEHFTLDDQLLTVELVLLDVTDLLVFCDFLFGHIHRMQVVVPLVHLAGRHYRSIPVDNPLVPTSYLVLP